MGTRPGPAIKKPKGTCTFCGRLIALRMNGTLQGHGYNLFNDQWCYGSGLEPAEDQTVSSTSYGEDPTDHISQPTKTREGDQPLPTPVREGEISVQAQVIADIEARIAVGVERYGQALHINNGRDMLQDAYEEAVDQTMYLKGVILERTAAQERLRVWLSVNLTWERFKDGTDSELAEQIIAVVYP